MTRPCRICVVGSANVDMTFRTPRLPKAGETLASHSMHIGMGGKGANQAVVAARLGAQVAFVACVGNDSFGKNATQQYQQEGIDTTDVRQDSNQPTGTAVIFVDDHAENCIVIAPGANAALTVDDVKRAANAIRQADAVLCQLETPIEATLEAFRIARAAGKLTILTPAPFCELPDELLSLCDVCVPNKFEIEFMVGRTVDHLGDARAAANALMARGVTSVALTMGGDGAFIADSSETNHIPIVKVDAVDTTGAGDAFTAALAVSLASGLPFQAAARRASLVAAITVTRVGTQSAFPSRAEVDQFVACKS